jgi:hypothetical protein
VGVAEEEEEEDLRELATSEKKTTEKCTGNLFRLSVLKKICENWV